MRARLLVFLPVAAAAGFVAGTLFSRSDGTAPTEPSTRSQTARGEAGVGHAAEASDAQEAALGAALTELREQDNDLRGLVALGKALAQLDSKGIARLLEFLERDTARRNGDRLGWLLKWWMNRDATAASAWMRPRLDLLAQDGPAGMSFYGSARGQMATAWATADPQGALDYARAHARTGLATALLREVMSAWKDRDVRERLAVLLDFPPGKARETVLHELHRDWAIRDPAAAFASVQTLAPGPARDRAISGMLAQWAEKDPTAAFAQFRALGMQDPRTLTNLITRGAAENPVQALGWLAQLDPLQAARCAPYVVDAWVQKDPAAALNWALANGVRLSHRFENESEVEHDGFGRSQWHTGSGVNPLTKAFTAKPAETMAWLRSLPAGSERDRVMEMAVSACRNREQALALFATLPPDAAARTAKSVMLKFHGAPEQGRAWAESLPAGPARSAAWTQLASLAGNSIDLPPGPDRDAYLSGITTAPDSSNLKPTDRLALIRQISDPVLRRDVFDEAMEHYLSAPPEYAFEARAALEAADVPEAWKQRWRTWAAPK